MNEKKTMWKKCCTFLINDWFIYDFMRKCIQFSVQSNNYEVNDK